MLRTSFLRPIRNLAPKLLSLAFVAISLSTQTSFAATDWSAIQAAMKANGVVFPGDVLRFDLVRKDLTVSVNGTDLPPNSVAAVANGFVAFKEKKNGQFYVDGSLPAQESEVDAVEDSLLAHSQIHIAAIGSRLLFESPKLIWVHFEATGNGADLATWIAAALTVIHNPQEGNYIIPGPSSVFDPSSILPPNILTIFDEGLLEQIFQTFAFYLPRPDENRIDLANGVPAETGLGAGQTFYIQVPFSGGTNVTLDIDFALRANELPAVQSLLRGGGFSISSQGNNHIQGTPTLYFLHATASGDGFTLGNTLFSVIQVIQNDNAHDH